MAPVSSAVAAADMNTAGVNRIWRRVVRRVFLRVRRRLRNSFGAPSALFRVTAAGARSAARPRAPGKRVLTSGSATCCARVGEPYRLGLK